MKVFSRVRCVPINSKVVRNLRNIIIPYSLIKTKANKPPPYSTLNPDTSSDSPSARSKGVRLASAMQSKSHTKNNGAQMHINHNPCWFICNFSIE